MDSIMDSILYYGLLHIHINCFTIMFILRSCFQSIISFAVNRMIAKTFYQIFSDTVWYVVIYVNTS